MSGAALGVAKWSGRWACAVLCGGALACGPAVDTGGDGSSGGAETVAPPGDSSGDGPGDGPGDPSRPGSAGSETMSDTAVPEPPPPDENEIDGPYLIAFRTVVAAETPLQFVGEVRVVDDVLDMTLVPLTLSPGSVDAPREELPEFARSFNDIPLASDGTFVLELPETFLPGATNPITGSDIVATMRLVGWFNGRRLCGNLSGQITEPANIDLTGSSAAGIPMDDGVLPPVADAVCG